MGVIEGSRGSDLTRMGVRDVVVAVDRLEREGFMFGGYCGGGVGDPQIGQLPPMTFAEGPGSARWTPPLGVFYSGRARDKTSSSGNTSQITLMNCETLLRFSHSIGIMVKNHGTWIMDELCYVLFYTIGRRPAIPLLLLLHHRSGTVHPSSSSVGSSSMTISSLEFQ